jgi:hypothetical protein
MGALTVDEANFKSERDVVKEEYRFASSRRRGCSSTRS